MALITTLNPMHNTFSSLFVQNGEDFQISEDCLAILEDILGKLAAEDCTLRTFRRAIGFGQNIKKNLIPLLLLIKDDTKIEDASKIIDTTIKIMVNLTIPIEYLLSIEEMSTTDVGKHMIFELNKLLASTKEAFAESKSTKAVVDHIKFIVESDPQLDLEQCDNINNSLLLLRNILHIPEYRTPSSNHTSMQNQLIWNLFTQSIDKIIIYLMCCPQKVYWGVTLVQLIALMYKDQHVGTLQKLLNVWLETSYSDSSEDNESNTSPPDRGSDDFSPAITSDPTSDSSDNGGKDGNKLNNNNTRAMMERTKSNASDTFRTAKTRNKSLSAIKRIKSTETETSTSSGVSSMGQSVESMDSGLQINQSQSASKNCRKFSSTSLCQSEISDCGYVTQVENQESISTSSNDDDHPHQKPLHQKPPIFQKTRYNANKNRATTALDKKELRRKKLVKRRKTNIINMKDLIHHLPTDEDIANILKEFTVDFLLKSYGTLVKDVHTELLTNIHLQIDTSHFFWLITYFLKFAVQLELDLEHISPVLSYDILSYLVFQGIWICEELEISCKITDIDLKPCLRRLHLVVTAIREFLQGVEAYQKMIHLNDNDKDYLVKLQIQIVTLKDLRKLLVLLLKKYNVNLQTKQYLQDLILTNHNFFLFMDNSSSMPEQHYAMMEHLKSFATVEIMRQYGLLLENFKQNGEFINNCIFTMMHHIGGDMNHVETLFQPSILKTFSQIWEIDYEICDDWADLIEYVIHKFINTSGTYCVENVELDDDSTSKTKKAPSECSFLDEIIILFRWTKEEKDNLLKYYNQSKKFSDTITKISERYRASGFKHKSQQSIIEELLQQKIITDNEYRDLLRYHRIDRIEDEIPEDVPDRIPPREDYLIDSDTKVIKDYLYKENKGKFLVWLQNLLLETCYVKLMLENPQKFIDNIQSFEPSVYYFVLSNLPIPLVPWTVEQDSILKYQPFVLLLHRLGFFLPADTGKVFVRIPNFWSPDYMFSIAQLLGPIDKSKLKFDTDQLKGVETFNAFEVKSHVSATLSDTGKFLMPELKFPPSVLRYTPLPNSSEWFQNDLRIRVTTTTTHTYEQISSTSQLSIAIPENEMITCNFPPPELAIASKIVSTKMTHTNMECSPILHDDNDLVLREDIERNSNCDMASVASDLTRMCVSDEEDKLSLVLYGSETNS